MTPVSGDLDELLRRALRAEADLIEPAEGGLERIRQRTHAPWLVRQASLMLTECVDLARLIVIRLEPGFTSARAAVAARGGAWGALAGLVMPSRRGQAAYQGGPDGPAGPWPPPVPPRSSLSWLRPVLAAAGAVVIVAAGVLGVAQMRDKLVLELFSGSNPPASTGPGSTSSGNTGPSLNGQTTPAGIVPPATTPSSSATPSPTTSCSSSPSNQQASPTSTPTATPTATPTPSPTDTTPAPTPAPSPTESSPTPAPSTGGSAQPASDPAAPSAILTRASVVSAAIGCGSASPSSTLSS